MWDISIRIVPYHRLIMSDEVSVGALKELIVRQQGRIDALEKRVHQAERQVEAAEIYSRQDCLILRGKLDIRPNCSLRDEAMRLIQHHTGVQFPAWCLNTVHWLGKGDSLILRFNNKGVREAIYRNRVPKDVTKRGLFIHESLTTAKIQTISKCAKLRRSGKIVTYFTQSGHVYIKRTKESPSILVPDNLTEQDIADLVERQPSSYREAAARSTRTEHKAQEQPTVPPTEDQGSKGEQKSRGVGPPMEQKSEMTSSSETATNAVNTQVVTELPSEAKVTKDARQPKSRDPTPSAKHSGTDRGMSKEKTDKTKSVTQKEKIGSSASNKQINDDTKVTECKEEKAQNSKSKQKNQDEKHRQDREESGEISDTSSSSSRGRQLRRTQRKHKKQNGK